MTELVIIIVVGTCLLVLMTINKTYWEPRALQRYRQGKINQFNKINGFNSDIFHFGKSNEISIDFSQRLIAYDFGVGAVIFPKSSTDNGSYLPKKIPNNQGDIREVIHYVQILTSDYRCPIISIDFQNEIGARQCLISMGKLAQTKEGLNINVNNEIKVDVTVPITNEINIKNYKNQSENRSEKLKKEETWPLDGEWALTAHQIELAKNIASFLSKNNYSIVDGMKDAKEIRVTEAIKLIDDNFKKACEDERPSAGSQKITTYALKDFFWQGSGTSPEFGYRRSTLKKYTSDNSKWSSTKIDYNTLKI